MLTITYHGTVYTFEEEELQDVYKALDEVKINKGARFSLTYTGILSEDFHYTCGEAWALYLSWHKNRRT